MILLLLACGTTHVAAVHVLDASTSHYIVADDDGILYDCLSYPLAAGAWDPYCVRVEYHDQAPRPKE